MTKKPTILVSGYGQWAKAAVNPAAQVAHRLRQEDHPDCTLITAELPVDSAALQGEVDRLLDLHAPDGWIGLGVPGAAVVQPEMVGINWRHFSVPDAAGEVARVSPIVPDGPAAFNATLPCPEMVEALLANGIPAALSFSAGTHLCNQLIYTLGHSTERRGIPLRSGFVHIPQSPENVAQMEGMTPITPSMSLETATRAIGVCVDVLCRVLVRSR